MSDDGCVRCGFIGSHTCVTSANGSVRITAMTPSRPLADPQADRIATLERELSAVTAERDALLKDRWAGPWEYFDGTEYVRMSNTDGVAASARSHGMAGTFGWYSNHLRTDFVGYASIALAKAAADAALLAAGWYLAPTPPTGTPGDGTR